MPQRIQLRRTKGWRKPEGAVVVSRPSRWGNPYVALPLGGAWSVFRRVSTPAGRLDYWIDRVGVVDHSTALRSAVQCYRSMIENWAEDEYGDEDDPCAAALFGLRGRDLACWCPLDRPCHGDVLLDLANTTPNPCSAILGSGPESCANSPLNLTNGILPERTQRG